MNNILIIGQLLEEGEKVRSTGWDDDEYIYLKEGKIYDETNTLYKMELCLNWEIFKKKPKLINQLNELKNRVKNIDDHELSEVEIELKELINKLNLKELEK